MKKLVLVALCLPFITGGACRRSADDVPPGEVTYSEDAPTLERTESSAAAEPGTDSPRPYDPASIGDAVHLDPDPPMAGKPFEVRAGPITFRNGCHGIERSWAEGPDEDGVILLRWKPREVPPDAMCTMALHSQWIEASLPGLDEGEYTVVAQDVGKRTFTVEHEE